LNLKNEEDKTMLAKKFDFTEIEARIQKFWEENEIYKFDENSDKEIYSIDTPPPTVSGKQHIGHIFSYTQAEMIARFQRTQGKNVFYPFGFDDNGLPTERLVERELGIIAREMPRSTFIEKCLSTTEKYEKEFKALWQSLGFSVDWDQQYQTVGPMAQRISQKSFIDLVKKGKAYIEESPVLWCPHCRTSIAQAELESKELESSFNTITFKIGDEEISIATTRPEMLYGCVAIFVHPEDERYSKYIGQKGKVPIYDFEVPILGDKKVDKDKGTGIVMCCTFGDTTDLEWYKEYDLPYKKILSTDGRIDSAVPLIGGMFIKAGRKRIIAMLEEKGLLTKTEAISHPVSIHERCGNEVEILPSRQWYIDILSDKDKFLAAADEINWYPSHMKKRYITWVENLKWDWCISRQRFFGVPIPVWYCEACGEHTLPEDGQLPVNPIETEPNRKCSCGHDKWLPETAVLDTWATSSVTPQINGKWQEPDDRTEKIMPMGLRTQAHEIIRTWAFYTIVKSIHHTGEIPWKDIMICGFVLAKKGEKISKSKKNDACSPSQLIKKYSADAVRYWAANSRLGTDMMFSEDELQGSKRFMTKLWNAAKFTLMHLEDFDGKKPKKILADDQWIMDKYNETIEECTKHLNSYEVGLARLSADDFFWKDYCDNYLELVKDRVYKPEVYGEENRKSGQYALYNAFLGILKMYSIFAPHMTEEIYQAFFRKFENETSIHQTLWNKGFEKDETLMTMGKNIKMILSEARKFKSERNLSMKEELNEVRITVVKGLSLIEEARPDLIACTKAKNLHISEGAEFKVEIKL